MTTTVEIVLVTVNQTFMVVMTSTGHYLTK